MRSCFAGLVLLVVSAMPAVAAPPTSSSVKGVVLTPLTDLPRAPPGAPVADVCEPYRIKPASPAGRMVAGRGWIVTSEARLGSYRAVSFTGSFEPGTSSVCFAHDANIAIFDGARLVALAYNAKAADRTLGTLEPIEPDGLLIHGGDGPGVPVGELHAVDGGLRVTPVVRLQPVCSGRATVPNIYGLDIRKARRLLMAGGWRPQRPSETPGELDQATALAKQGVVEAASCSGTGYGFCAFEYGNSLGGLSVTTMGENFMVSSYEARCR